MKTLTFISFLFITAFNNTLFSQSFVEHTNISESFVDLATESVLGQVDINPTEPGKVIVTFDGYCRSTPGDVIVLAASDTPFWGVNYGNVYVEATDNDINGNSFSHTRVYDVTPGNHTFYAVGHNYLETDGDGIAGIYGRLTVTFIPSADDVSVEHTNISESFVDLATETVLGQVDINPSESGRVIVTFDGTCSSTPGDRIILAASNSQTWSVNTGSVAVEATDSDVSQNSFSHTMVYDVNPGNQIFYAVGHNFVETDGDGIAHVYGRLTVIFIPTGDDVFVEHTDVHENSVNLTNETVLEQVDINPTVPGKAIVSFDGTCLSTPGDRIILAASDSPSWDVNYGSVAVEATNNDLNRNCFSHTRVYDVNPGSQTFYAVGHNFVETDGDGVASFYGRLTVIFIPENTLSVNSINENNFIVYPNPTEKELNIEAGLEGSTVKIIAIDGSIVYSGVLDASKTVNVENIKAGSYFIYVENLGVYSFKKL